MINLKPLKLDTLIKKMKHGEYFTLSRYKDGEFYAILQNKVNGNNCDKHKYFPDMGEALLNSLKHPKDHLYGMQPYALRCAGKEIEALFEKHKIDIVWHESDMIHTANMNGELFPLIEQLKKMDVVIIGPERLKTVRGKILDNVELVTVPLVDCWLHRNIIEPEILKIAGEGKIYLFSSSMPTAVFIDDLFPLIGKNSWMIDFGSIWESLLGINIRSYQRGMPELVRRKNLGL